MSLVDRLAQGAPTTGFLKVRIGKSTYQLPGCMEQSGRILQVKVLLGMHEELYDQFLLEIGIYREGSSRLPTIGEVAEFHSTNSVATLVQLGKPFVPEYQSDRPIEVVFKPRFVMDCAAPQVNLAKPIGASAAISGLTHWMHGSRVIRSMEAESRALDGGPSLVTLGSLNHQPKSFDFSEKGLSVGIEPGVESYRSDWADIIGLRFQSAITIEGGDDFKWADYFELIRSFQELVELLAWSRLPATNLRLKFRNLEASEYEDWISVLNRSFISEDNALLHQQVVNFILPFEKLTRESLERWFNMRTEYSRSFRLFLQVLHSRAMGPEVTALQLGAGFEALGYVTICKHFSKTQANKAPTIEFFEDASSVARRLFPDRFESWPELANSQYQAMKHLRKPLLSTGVIAELNNLSTLVFQTWLAHELGATDDEIVEYTEETGRLKAQYFQLPDPSDL